MTVDTHDDDFEIETAELDNLPADEANADDDLDEDFGLSYDGLTQAEIDAINSPEGDEDDGQDDNSEESAEVDTDNDSTTGDDDTADTATPDDAGEPTTDNQDDDWQQEVAATADTRAAIDAEFDEKLAELEALGEKYDNGDILDGAYNTAKTRIDRELKRIEAREAELVTKEDKIAKHEASQQEQQQQDFASAVSDFMARPENNVFVEGSAEFAALDQQLGAIASAMAPGMSFDVLLDKARNAVGVYMDLPAAEQKAEQASKPADKQDPKTMPSISSMPSVVPNSTDDSKFAHLDKLSGDKLERALADMTPEQEAEYLMQ